jgi:hypothetical protein
MLAQNPVFHAKTKHIWLKHHIIKGVLECKSIELGKVHTDDKPTNLVESVWFGHC